MLEYDQENNTGATITEWKDYEVLPGFKFCYSGRVELMARFIDANDKNVVDFGAGDEYLDRLLDSGVKYIPLDYIKRSENTVVCDVNRDPLPDLRADVALISGFLNT